MCRIDRPFGRQSLDEKSDPEQRFIQALDESGVEGSLRELLLRHFGGGAHRELDRFDRIEIIEAALVAGREKNTLQAQIAAFVAAIEDKVGPREFPIGPFKLPSGGDTAFFRFAKDVAASVFGSEPVEFYKCFKFLHQFNYRYYLTCLAPEFYGEDFYLQPEFFDPLKSPSNHSELQKEYSTILERGFNPAFPVDVESLYRSGTAQSGDAIDPEWANLEKSVAFQKAWLRYSSMYLQAKDSFALLKDLKKKLDRLISMVKGPRRERCFPTGSEEVQDGEQQDPIEWVADWLRNVEQELENIWCRNVCLKELPKEIEDELGRIYHRNLLPLVPGQETDRVTAMLHWSLENDLQQWGKHGASWSILRLSQFGGYWYASPYQNLWLEELGKALHCLPVLERFDLLKNYFDWTSIIPKRDLPAGIDLLPETEAKSANGGEWFRYPGREEDHIWWNEQLRRLPEDDYFPSSLLPHWMTAACRKLSSDHSLLPLVDKGFGLLRSALAQGGEIPPPEELKSAWSFLERSAPEKAFRHRLLLLRNAPAPCGQENLEVDRNGPCPWTMAEIIDSQLSKQDFRQLDRTERIEVEARFLSDIQSWFAQFCLQRLKLRKGEKANDGYRNEQVVEPLPIWRQAYLKALLELGTDLKGDAHKAIFFIRNNDPDDDVRGVARDSYKAVRREFKKNLTSEDIRRGMIAAYWWLLLAQRQALGEKVDDKAALLTRRRQLRRP